MSRTSSMQGDTERRRLLDQAHGYSTVPDTADVFGLVSYMAALVSLAIERIDRGNKSGARDVLVQAYQEYRKHQGCVAGQTPAEPAGMEADVAGAQSKEAGTHSDWRAAERDRADGRGHRPGQVPPGDRMRQINPDLPAGVARQEASTD